MVPGGGGPEEVFAGGTTTFALGRSDLLDCGEAEGKGKGQRGGQQPFLTPSSARPGLPACSPSPPARICAIDVLFGIARSVVVYKSSVSTPSLSFTKPLWMWYRANGWPSWHVARTMFSDHAAKPNQTSDQLRALHRRSIEPRKEVELRTGIQEVFVLLMVQQIVDLPDPDGRRGPIGRSDGPDRGEVELRLLGRRPELRGGR